jgi:hypothetical protein
MLRKWAIDAESALPSKPKAAPAAEGEKKAEGAKEAEKAAAPARVMGMEKELGTIEAGKRADLILVKGNPLEDIHAIRNVEFVMTGGKMFTTGELWESVGFLP